MPELWSLDHMRRALPFLALSLVLVFTGCVKALLASHSTAVQMRVASREPQQYAVRVTRGEPADYSVASDGAVSFSVPGHRGCSTYLCGVKIADGSGEGDSVVQLRRGERVVHTLSLRQIAKLPTDETGYSIVRIGD
jgi:hypothetical protein